MEPLSHPELHGDVEKHSSQRELKAESVTITTKTESGIRPSTPSTDSTSECDSHTTPTIQPGKLAYWNAKIEGLNGLEARGISRVLPEEKHSEGVRNYLQMLALWFGMNLAALNIITGLLGVLVFELGWVDCVLIVIFACGLSACAASYTSTFGPVSGIRTMILGRFVFGYWPSKLACILNLIMQVGWGIIGCILSGQMFSAINDKGLSIAVGCVISALLIGVVATFGISMIQRYERYASLPQMFAMLILLGKAASNFDTSVISVGSDSTITANRCSFFALEFASVIGFAALGADFYVYYPTTTPKWITFATTWSGTWLALIFCNIIGVGIATGVAGTPAWSDSYEISSGALLLQCYDGLGGFGSFCVVILALGTVTNIAPCTYSAALTIQVLGRYAKAVPRWAWCVVITLIELVCSVAGRNDLFNIFENFLPIMSYWVCPWVTIVLEEHLLFHVLRGVAFDWSAWEDQKRLPIGAAALLAWIVGWAGAIIGMYQAWYQGPVALKIGGHGGDVGAWISIAFASVTYPPLRYLELKKFGR